MVPKFGQPAGLTLRRFAQKIPNDGLIRYYGFLSQERILITSTKGFKEVLVHMGYDFTKTFQMKFAISRFTGEGLGYSEGDEHRVRFSKVEVKYPENGGLILSLSINAST
jgi:hypothetical protein